MHLPPPPDPRELLPPLVACLPTAFVSPHPPPALLPLLSPLLRQRVSFLAGSSHTSSSSDGWLPLLSWDAQRGGKLSSVVERMELEPHPVSGEVEIDDPPPPKYRRVDEETLHCRLELPQFELLPVYLWCESDEHGGTGPGWKLAELNSLEEAAEDQGAWLDSILQANDAASQRDAVAAQPNGTNGNAHVHTKQTEPEDKEDDDYWASYDRTPGRTPGNDPSPRPQPLTSTQPTLHGQSREEHSYYARYGAEVQPAMDSHDPDEETPDLGRSTLNGDSLLRSDSVPNGTSLYPSSATSHPVARPTSRPNNLSLYPADPDSGASNDRHARERTISAPRPISPASSQSSVDRLETKAAAMSSKSRRQQQQQQERAHLAIKQHISTDIKSLFRLAKSTGMDREEFEEVVGRELQVLDLMERDE